MIPLILSFLHSWPQADFRYFSWQASWQLGLQEMISGSSWNTVGWSASIKQDRICPQSRDHGMWKPKNVGLGLSFSNVQLMISIIQNFSPTLSLSCMHLFYRTALRDVAHMTLVPSPSRTPQANSFADVKGRLSVYAVEQSVSCGRIGYCHGRTISCSYQSAQTTRFSKHSAA